MARASLLIVAVALPALSPLLAGCAEGGGTRAEPEPQVSCFDADQDGHASVTCGGDDCDDTDPYVSPSELDGPWHFEARYRDKEERLYDMHLDAADSGHWLTWQKLSGDEPKYPSVTLSYRQVDADGYQPPLLLGAAAWQTRVASTLDHQGMQLLYRQPDGAVVLQRQASAWQREMVVEQDANHVYLALQGEDTHVAYALNTTKMNLFHARRVGDKWDHSYVAPGWPRGLLVTDDGTPYVVSEQGGRCVVFSPGPDGWIEQPLSEYSGCEVMASALDASGALRVLYRAGESPHTEVRLVRYAGGEASPAVVAAKGEPLLDWSWSPVALVFDADGAAHITLQVDVPAGAQLWYASDRGGSWWSEPVCNNCDGVMALTSSGEPVIAISRVADNGEAPQFALAYRRGPDGIDQNCDGADGG